MHPETTQNLPQPDEQPAAGDSSDPSGLDTTQLLSYHSGLGQPLGLCLPTQPVEEMSWHARYRMVRPLGSGAQGVVYLALREGVDGYRTLVAVKMYFRQRIDDHGGLQADADYVQEMRRIARHAQQVSEVQHDNLIAIRDFVSLDDTRVMVMEWIDGLDLRHLLDLKRHRQLRDGLSAAEWNRLNDVVVTHGVDHCRLRPGVAVDVLRGCLAGLSALHQHGVAHCDLKPANIMIKRTGTKKIIDIDSSCVPAEDDDVVRGTPYYMAPEQLRERKVRLRSDIASLGYILIEMLTGRLLFKQCKTFEALQDAKARLPDELERLLPFEIRSNSGLVGLCRKMVANDPEERFPDADAADLGRLGAAAFHRELVKSDLSSEYDRELAWWIEAAYPAAAAGEAT